MVPEDRRVWVSASVPSDAEIEVEIPKLVLREYALLSLFVFPSPEEFMENIKLAVTFSFRTELLLRM